MSSSHPSLWVEIPIDFSHPDVTWALLPGTLVLGWGAQCGIETLGSPEGPLQMRSLQILNHCMWVQGQPVSCLHPSYQSHVASSVNP